MQGVSYLNTEETINAEHRRIANFLKQRKFIEKALPKRRWHSEERKKAAIKLLKRLYKSTGEQLTPLSIDMGYDVSNGRKIIDALNKLLGQLCKNEYHINPAIQIFSQSSFSKEIFCHFACAENKEVLDNNKIYPTDIVSLKVAKANLPVAKHSYPPEDIRKHVYFRGTINLSNKSNKSDNTKDGLLEIRSLGRYKNESGWKYPAEYLSDDWLALIWVTHGRCSGEINKTDCILNPGQIVILLPNSETSDFDVDEDCVVWWCFLDGPMVREVIKSYKLKEGIFSTDTNPKRYFASWAEKLNLAKDEGRDMRPLAREYSVKSDQLLGHIGKSIANQDSIYKLNKPE